jgi:hypothetical protein
MSTIATKFSASKLQVGTAAVATVLAAATLTPAIAEAAPNVSFAPISQASFADIFEYPFVGDAPKAAAAADPVTDGVIAIVNGVVTFVGTVAYVGLSFVGNAVVAVGEAVGFQPLVALGGAINGVANTIAEITNAGPYAT